MSLATTIGAGTLLGTVLAVGVYAAVAPDDPVPAAVEVAPSFGPVPTPTVTVEAEGCVDPAVLEDDECVVHEPGPTVTVAPVPASAPAPQPQVAAPAAAARATSDGDAEHEDGEHEDEDHEDEPGEPDDD